MAVPPPFLPLLLGGTVDGSVAEVGVRAHLPGVTSVTWYEGPCTLPGVMSEHTEQLNDLAERIAAARGFL
jgi:hypothetical protein